MEVDPATDTNKVGWEDLKTRSYQDEIYQTCIKRNTIVYLPTGAGKTYIAIMVVKHFAKDLQIPIAQGGRRSVFLTNTVALAHQQAECISKTTPLKVSVYTGDMNVDAWRHDRWYGEFDDNQVIVATCQIILDVVRHGYLKIENFNLMIFDECHHANKEHPMVQLMAKFKDCPVDKQPRVIGLTGMLTSPSVKLQNVISDLTRLESTMRGTISTVKGLKAYHDVLMYSTCPNEQRVLYEVQPPSTVSLYLSQKMNELMACIKLWPVEAQQQHFDASDLRNDRQPKPQKVLDKICSDFLYQINILGLYGGALGILALIVDFELKKRECAVTNFKALLRHLITSCEEMLHIALQVMDDEDDEINDNNQMAVDPAEDEVEVRTSRLIDEYEIADDRVKILTNSSPRVQKLLYHLKEHVEENDRPIKGLIFVKRRTTAKLLCHVINRYANALPKLPLRTDFMVGNNSNIPNSIETILSNQSNKKVLEKFKRDEINLIIATSVLEEGIDLQECNLVICFDAPETFRSYVQSKGRARMKDSAYVVFTEASKQTEMSNKMREWNEINDILRQYLVEKAIDRAPPNQDDIDNVFFKKHNKIYKTDRGATVDFASAVQLLNRYCDSLPSDQFTSSAVSWSKSENNGKTTVNISLPIQSPIQEEVAGDEMPSLKMAKQSAAYNACVKLHKIGELSDNLLPFNKQKCLDKYHDRYFKIWDDYKKDNENKQTRHLVGTTKNFRMHNITVPDELTDSLPRTNEQLYLYVFKIKPNFTCDYDKNVEVFHELLESNRSFGILTAKMLPRLSLMKLYQSFGEIQCEISHEPTAITLSNEESLLQLKRFHCTLFRDLLDTWKTFLLCDHKDSVIIVPTIDKAIDWSIVEAFQTWSPLRDHSEFERRGHKYVEEDWLHKVVSPWYRVTHSTRYIVTRVSQHETPYSQFPNDNYDNYADYVADKYPGIQIIERDQFLIEVKGITTRLNLVHAGDGEDGRKNKKHRDKEMLIPELCHNFHFPGDLWLKAICVPSILHRLTYLLHAERIRIEINNFVGIRVNNYEPKPVIEKMASRPLELTRPTIQNPIVYPRREESQAKELKSADLTRFDQNILAYYPEIEEPIDLERHFDQVYSFEIDYFHKFCHDFENLKISKSDSMLSSRRFQRVPLAVCDVPPHDKLRINLLELKSPESIARGVEQHEVLAAMTSAASGDVFHLELFEVLGDAFLKFSVSLYLLQNHPDFHEGHLTTLKGQIVGNRHLCYCAMKLMLPGMIKIYNFSPKDDWQPPMLKVHDYIKATMKEFNVNPQLLFSLELSQPELEHGEVTKDNLKNYIQKYMENVNNSDQNSSMDNFLGVQRLSDKTCADNVEALLGVCVKNIGIGKSFKVLQMFGVLPPPQGNHDIEKMLDVKLKSPRIRTNISDREVDGFLTNYRDLEESIGYQFRDRAYLLQALTHPSYPTNRVTGCYQQLEFLGDAVLDFLITAYISERCPHMDPGKLTDLRSALVNNVTLACLCVRYNIHLYILSQNAELTETIGRFVNFQIKKNHEVDDHVDLLMEERDLEAKMADYIDVPKTLGDVIEAIIGGIFLDSGNDLQVTWKVIYRLMHKELDKFMANVPIQLVRKLYEFPNANPEFDAPVENKELKKVLVGLQFTCNGEILRVNGFGDNKWNAKRAAAKIALNKLNSNRGHVQPNDFFN